MIDCDMWSGTASVQFCIYHVRFGFLTSWCVDKSVECCICALY